VFVLHALHAPARKDRKTKARDPVTTRYVAALFEAVGTDRVVTLDVHNLAAYQNAFRCRSEHLEACRLFAAHFAELIGIEPVAVVSPDAGGIKRAERFREVLASTLGRPVGAAFAEKYRSQGVVSGDLIVALACIVVTDSVPPSRLPAGPARDKLTVLPTDTLFAEAIRRIHSGGSIADLLGVD